MHLRSLVLALLVAVTMAPELAAKARKSDAPELHRLYETVFADFAIPELASTKHKFIVIGLRPANKTWGWQCVLRVLMQRGPVVELDLEHGLVAAPPLVAQFDPDGAQLRLVFLDELYHAQGSNEYVRGFDLLSIQNLLREISTQVSVQCEGDLRLRDRWRYLRPEP